MTASRSFDRAIGFYDATRELPAEVLVGGLPAILQAAGDHAKILDVGTGSGRISVPLLRLGANLVGCDISLKMMGLLHEKHPSACLAQADASCLPFADGFFDAVVTCHVMHVVGPWRLALAEFRRVLKPRGIYINAYTERDQTSPRLRIRSEWRQILAGYGVHESRPGARNALELREGLRQMGAECQENPLVQFERSYTIRSVVDGIARRVYSGSWDIPEDVFRVSLQDFLAWVDREYPDQNQVFIEKSCFNLDLTRFDA
jgi:ubiquinone/menaquinone biosynthesis C-methylase UbiE